MDKYKQLDEAKLQEMLNCCADFQERRKIRSAIRELKGIKTVGDTIVTYSFGPGFKRRSSPTSSTSSITPTSPGGPSRIEITKVQNIENKNNNKILSKSNRAETKTADKYENIHDMRMAESISGDRQIKYSPTQTENRPGFIPPSSQNGSHEHMTQGKDYESNYKDEISRNEEAVAISSIINMRPITKFTSSFHISSFGFPYTAMLLDKDCTQKSEAPVVSKLGHISQENKSAVNNTVADENSLEDFVLSSEFHSTSFVSNGQHRFAEHDCIQSNQDIVTEMKSDNENDNIKSSLKTKMQSVEITRGETILSSVSQQKHELIEEDCGSDQSNISCCEKLFDPDNCSSRFNMEGTCGDVEVDNDKLLVKTVSSTNVVVECAYPSASDSDRSGIKCETEQSQYIATGGHMKSHDKFMNVDKENCKRDQSVDQIRFDTDENYSHVTENLNFFWPETVEVNDDKIIVKSVSLANVVVECTYPSVRDGDRSGGKCETKQPQNIVNGEHMKNHDTLMNIDEENWKGDETFGETRVDSMSCTKYLEEVVEVTNVSSANMVVECAYPPTSEIKCEMEQLQNIATGGHMKSHNTFMNVDKENCMGDESVSQTEVDIDENYRICKENSEEILPETVAVNNDKIKIIMKSVSSANMMVECTTESDSGRNEVKFETEQPQNIANNGHMINHDTFTSVENLMRDENVGQTQVDTDANKKIGSNLGEIMSGSVSEVPVAASVIVPDVKSDDNVVRFSELPKDTNTDASMDAVGIGVVHNSVIVEPSVSISADIREHLTHEETLTSPQSLNAAVVTEHDATEDVDSEHAEKLRCEEEDLQTRLMQCTDFASRKKIREALRELNEKAPRTFEKQKKVICDSLIHQKSTSLSELKDTVDKKSRSETDYNSIKDLDTLRELLGETQDQNDKRRIRHAMRQLREQERNKQSNGLKNCAVNGRISSLSRSQSLINEKVQIILQADYNKNLSDKWLLSHSSSFTGGLAKQETKSDSKKEELSLEVLQDNTEKSSQIRRWCTKSSRSERRKKSVKDESSERDSKVTSVDNTDSVLRFSQPTDYNFLSHSETSRSVDNTVRQTCAELLSIPLADSKQVSSSSDSSENSEITTINPEFNEEGSSKNLTFSNTSEIDFLKKHETHLHSSILNVTLKTSANLQRRKSEPVFVKKKLAPKYSLQINQSSDQEFHDWLENKKRTLLVPGLGFDELNSTREMEAAFSDILDEVDNHSDTLDNTPVTGPMEEVRGCRGKPADIVEERDNYNDTSDNIPGTGPLEEVRDFRGKPHDILEKELCENKQDRETASETKVEGRPTALCEKLDKKVDLEDLAKKEVITSDLVTNGDNRECNNNIREVNVLKSNMALDLTQFQDKDTAISVIEGDDGSVTIHQVTKKDEGDKVVIEITKHRRTESCTEEEERDKIIETKVISPGGTSVYQKDITKTKKKLTARGSEYYSRNNAVIQRIKKRDGPEYLQHDICIESDNFSVTKGESWGDKTSTQVQLNRSDSQVEQAVEKEKEADSCGNMKTSQAVMLLNHLNVSKTSSGYGSEEELVVGPPAAKPADHVQSFDTTDNVPVIAIPRGCRTIGSPEIVCPLKDIVAPDGSTCCLKCVVLATPAPTVTWYQNGDQLDMLDSMMTSYDEASGEIVLEISAVTSDQSGEFRCVFRNLLGEAETAAQLTVNTKTFMPPVFTKGLQDVTVDEGHSVVLECCVPDCKQIFWYKDGAKRRNSSDFRQTYDGLTARLEISDLILGDSGEYACIGRNEIAEAKTICIIQVRECLSESVVVPMFLTKPSSQIVSDQEKVIIECEVIGSPPPNIIWLKDGTEVNYNNRIEASFDGRVASLKIGRACLEDSGKYDCVVENSAGRVSADALVIVRARQRAPSIIQELSDTTVVVGKPFTFQCGIMGNPRPTILWRKDQCMIGNTKDFHQSYNDNVARLEVSDIYQQDAGFYECVATNNLGKTITCCHLCVQETKSILSTSNIACTEQKDAKHDITISLKELEHSGSSELIPEWNSAFQQVETVTLCTAQITSSKHRFQRDDTVTSNASQIISDKNKSTKEYPNSSSCDQKSNYTNFVSWQPEPIKNIVTVRRTESLKLPRTTANEYPEKLANNRIGSDENIFKSPRSHCKVDGSNSLINKFEKIAQTEQKAKPWQGMTLRRTESARLPSKESPSYLWKNLMVKNTESAVDNCDQGKSVEVRSGAPCTKLLFECNTGNNGSVGDRENAFRRLASEVTPLEQKGVALTRTSSLKILPTRKQTGLARSGSLKLPGNEEQSAVSSLVAQKRQFWEASSTNMPSYKDISDEDELQKLLSKANTLDERKKIRTRIRELHEIRAKEWEKKKVERENEMEDTIRKKFEQAEIAKKKQLQSFQDMASKPTSDRLDKYSSKVDAHIREKHAQADEDKKKTLQAFERIAADRAGGGQSYTTVSTEKVVGPGGTTTTTTVRKTETSVSQQLGLGGTGYARPAQEIIANQIARQLIGASGPNTGGQVTVKTESWNNRDGIVDKSQKTESWGAKPTGMSSQATVTSNCLVKVAYAKKAASTMRNAVAIKQELLRFCQRNTEDRLAAPGASSAPAPAPAAGQGGGGSRVTRSPSAIKQLLLEWCKAKVAGYENVTITNFSNSWNTGMAFCALIHHFYPEAFDFNKLNPKNRRYNFNLAFDTAQKYADISPLLDTDDMVKMKNPDWKCVFTYIQSFYRTLRDHDEKAAA